MRGRLSVSRRGALFFGLERVGAGDLAFALLVSVAAVVLASNVEHNQAANAGVAASVVVLLMTVPVAFARRNPLAVAGALAVGAALNWVLIGHLVRCGAALPTVFYAAFALGSCARSWSDRVAGLGLLAISIVCQAVTDPKLGLGVLVIMVPVAAAFMGAGVLLAGRNAAVAKLRARTAELREQRERNAQLAVAAEQARIAGDLDGFLHERVTEIAAASAIGRDAVDHDPDHARLAFVAIQETGRDALTHMRGVVSNLRDGAATEPQPVLAQIDRLLGQATNAQTRLAVSGDPRLLPPGLELSGYRVVEHLLTALEDDPGSRIDVSIAFRPDVLELTVAGDRKRRGHTGTALAAARERAAVHGGTVRTSAVDGRPTTVVQFPLAVSSV